MEFKKLPQYRGPKMVEGFPCNNNGHEQQIFHVSSRKEMMDCTGATDHFQGVKSNDRDSRWFKQPVLGPWLAPAAYSFPLQGMLFLESISAMPGLLKSTGLEALLDYKSKNLWPCIKPAPQVSHPCLTWICQYFWIIILNVRVSQASLLKRCSCFLRS